MPSNYTEHFKLSQWERPDKVLMDDFNDDNQKIDAALRDTRPYLLRSWITEEDADRVTFDISGIEWAKYSWVIFDITLPEKASIYLNVNGDGTALSGTSGAHGLIAKSSGTTDTLVMLCPVFYRDNVCLTNISMSKSGSTGNSNLPYRQLETLTLAIYGTPVDPQYIRKGTEIKIWAMK